MKHTTDHKNIFLSLLVILVTGTVFQNNASHTKYKPRYTDTYRVSHDYTLARILPQPLQTQTISIIDALAKREGSIQSANEAPLFLLKEFFSHTEVIVPIAVFVLYATLSLVRIVMHKRALRDRQTQIAALEPQLTAIDEKILNLTKKIYYRNGVKDAALRNHISSFLFARVDKKVAPNKELVTPAVTQDTTFPPVPGDGKKTNIPIFKKAWYLEEQRQLAQLVQQRAALQEKLDEATQELKREMRAYFKNNVVPVMIGVAIFALVFGGAYLLKRSETKQANILQSQLTELLATAVHPPTAAL